jgi:hypothetical protein
MRVDLLIPLLLYRRVTRWVYRLTCFAHYANEFIVWIRGIQNCVDRVGPTNCCYQLSQHNYVCLSDPKNGNHQSVQLSINLLP